LAVGLAQAEMCIAQGGATVVGQMQLLTLKEILQGVPLDWQEQETTILRLTSLYSCGVGSPQIDRD
jgi:hypothetical protein